MVWIKDYGAVIVSVGIHRRSSLSPNHVQTNWYESQLVFEPMSSFCRTKFYRHLKWLIMVCLLEWNMNWIDVQNCCFARDGDMFFIFPLSIGTFLRSSYSFHSSSSTSMIPNSSKSSGSSSNSFLFLWLLLL